MHVEAADRIKHCSLLEKKNSSICSQSHPSIEPEKKNISFFHHFDSVDIFMAFQFFPTMTKSRIIRTISKDKQNLTAGLMALKYLTEDFKVMCD